MPVFLTEILPAVYQGKKLPFTDDPDALNFFGFFKFRTCVFSYYQKIKFATNAAEYAPSFLFNHFFCFTSFNQGKSARE